jgi:hypothetical protein
VESPAQGAFLSGFVTPFGHFLGQIMRTALTTALMLMATIAWGDEPSTPTAQAEAAAETAAAKPADPAAASQTTTANETTTASAATDSSEPFKPPAGYRLKRVGGNEVYCTKVVVLGSRFAKEDCRTEAQLRDLEQQKASMRSEMDQRNRVCSGGGACGGN